MKYSFMFGNDRIKLSQLESERISYVPCTYKKPLFEWAGYAKSKVPVTLDRITKSAWVRADRLQAMTGVQIFTGFPTNRKNGSLFLVDIDIENHLLKSNPDVVVGIVDIYRNNVDREPCIVKTKSAGFRLSLFTSFHGSKLQFKDDHDKMLLEIFAKGLSRIDDRYHQYQGSIFDIPECPKSTIVEIRELILQISVEKHLKPATDRIVVAKSQLGNLHIQWDNNNKSQLFPTSYCRATTHKSNRDEVRFTRHKNGNIDGKCFNCGEVWWESIRTQRHHDTYSNMYSRNKNQAKRRIR